MSNYNEDFKNIRTFTEKYSLLVLEYLKSFSLSSKFKTSEEEVRYFLYEYELYLQERSKGEVKVTWDVLKKANTIEHIYPQEDSKDYWKTRFGKLSSKKRFRLCNSLGNLLLLSQSKNSELQNLGFDFKRKHKAKNGEDAGYFNGSYSEIGVAQNVDWTDETIRDRGIGLLEFMEHRWKIEIENKDGLLGIDVK